MGLTPRAPEHLGYAGHFGLRPAAPRPPVCPGSSQPRSSQLGGWREARVPSGRQGQRCKVVSRGQVQTLARTVGLAALHPAGGAEASMLPGTAPAPPANPPQHIPSLELTCLPRQLKSHPALNPQPRLLPRDTALSRFFHSQLSEHACCPGLCSRIWERCREETGRNRASQGPVLRGQQPTVHGTWV